ncbi:Histidine kinase [Chitinophaga sp. CF118]|uniref:sensor histidine kinase n=1 Tax=Chitinophaga sp. CF118 TaxID=1884367 RepID=UPI0008F3FCF7|nr:histidine kinase [Chitinophaga sp. CF118]SFD02347.1 Histidine kinase [Chitinophaga sp. CF118]
MFKRGNKYLIYHIIGSIAFLVLPLFLSPRPPEEIGFISRPTIRDFIGNFLMLFVFYLNYYLLIPVFYFKKKYIVYTFIVLTAFLLICLLPSLLTGYVPWGEHRQEMYVMPPAHGNWMPPHPMGGSFPEQIRHHVFLFMIVILASVLLRIRDRWFQAETARYNDELSHLKAQINPHFLFNTLNSIYSLALAKDDSAPDAIVELSDLMRYIIKDVDKDRVPLEKELKYINNYIALQQSRLGRTVKIVYEANVQAADKMIAPLIMISFIENAFKYGVNPDKISEIIIRLQLKENILSLYVANKKVAIAGVDGEGIGLENTMRRLQLLYPSRHQLHIEDTASDFSVQLSMHLT